IRPLLGRGAKLIVASRLGESASSPGSLGPGRNKKAPSILDTAELLSRELGCDVFVPDECTGDATKKIISGLKDNQICLLENLALADDTGQRAEAFARELLPYCDIFLGDSIRAFALDSATTTRLPSLVENRFASDRVIDELRSIARVLNVLSPPLLVIWGGNQMKQGVEVIRDFARSAETIAVGGLPANTLLKAKGAQLGLSAVEENFEAGARTTLEQWGDKLLLPEDFIGAASIRAAQQEVFSAERIPGDRMALDLGPRSIEALQKKVNSAGTVLWIGSVGFSRSEHFRRGTNAILEAMSASSAFTMVAGNDSVAAALAYREPQETQSNDGSGNQPTTIDCIAAGGKATLSLLRQSKLPGLEALRGNSDE
ncbi:MAG: phosphoglycerate kinase, partial [Polyangiaceae bacterium]|nr:phosphoglycerate kinase [Polyangiaceae bacterium]